MAFDREIDIDQMATAVEQGATLLDVREPMEFAQARVPGAVLMPMGQVPARVGEIDKAHPVCVICATGNRSLAVADWLKANGFDAASVAGGTRAWALSGRPIERG